MDENSSVSSKVETHAKEKAKLKFCNRCGERLPESSIFCPICGQKIEEISFLSTADIMENDNKANKNPEKRKKTIKIIIASAAACILLGGGYYLSTIIPISISSSYNGPTSEGVILDKNNSGISVSVKYLNGKSKPTDEWTVDAPAILSAEKASSVIVEHKRLKSELQVICTDLTKEHYIANCATIPYSKVQSNANTYNGTYVKIKGRVLQIVNENAYSILRVATDGTDDVYWVEYYGDRNNTGIFEKDTITVYGVCFGNKTYTTTVKTTVTIPGIRSKYIDPEEKNHELDNYQINDLSAAGYSYNYATGDGREGSTKTHNGYLYPEWAIAYDGAKSNSNSLDYFYYPKSETPARFSKNNEEFTNIDGYEWRGIKVGIKFFDGPYFLSCCIGDYYSLKEYDFGAKENGDLETNTFTVTYDGKTYSKCKYVSCWDLKDRYNTDYYAFVRVPKGYDGALVGFINTQGITSYSHVDSNNLKSTLGQGPVIFRLR